MNLDISVEQESILVEALEAIKAGDNKIQANHDESLVGSIVLAMS